MRKELTSFAVTGSVGLADLGGALDYFGWSEVGYCTWSAINLLRYRFAVLNRISCLHFKIIYLSIILSAVPPLK